MGVAALGVGLDVDPRLGFLRVAALDIGLGVDPLLGLTRVAALGIGLVLDLAGVAPLAVDGSLSLILIVLEGFTDHAVAALAGSRLIFGDLLVLWSPGHLTHPCVTRRTDQAGCWMAGLVSPRRRAGSNPT